MRYFFNFTFRREVWAKVWEKEKKRKNKKKGGGGGVKIYVQLKNVCKYAYTFSQYGEHVFV